MLIYCIRFIIADNIDPSEFVRHLLIESTPKGVHLKDCKDEPLFGKYIWKNFITTGTKLEGKGVASELERRGKQAFSPPSF